ncbi:MAG TPA: response regulator transcription factor [Bacteroidales bacterium]|jgi:DNA-binding CsgD family transcriptional regulator|nr:response regulator transcription factor [Bacteroidales bacterium]
MVSVLLAEQSYLLRKGLIHILRQFPEVGEIEILGSQLGIGEVLQHFEPDLLIVNSAITAASPDKNWESLLPEDCRLLHIINTGLPQGAPENQLSIYDSKVALTEKISKTLKAIGANRDQDESEELTPREKLILQHVALGKTNKEIAADLFISTHTVISHRKNITRKLDIKSVSGLTVYAILNGIINMEDIS